MIARSWLLYALWLTACSPGPTLVLGRLPDAGEDRDADDDEDARVYEPCERSDDCTSEARQYCDRDREHCVECLDEIHCGDDEWCSRNGRCISDR